MYCETALNDLRNQLRTRPGCKFVDLAEYCQLLVSRQKLVRADEPAANVRGLMDLSSGARFLIAEETLFASAM